MADRAAAVLRFVFNKNRIVEDNTTAIGTLSIG
jgi:hypothetical protein